MVDVVNFEKTTNSDLVIYAGDIRRSGYEKLTQKLEATAPRHGRATLALLTMGGEPDAGFRIARCMRHHYEKVSLLVPEYCKSAGTLIAIGADELVICDRGELGPLDVQINKLDEILESSSGLDIMQALAIMQSEAMNSFRSYLLELKSNTPITTKSAADMAAKLVVGLFAPVYSQIEPTRIGEVQRAISIALQYGHRLDAYGKNLRPGALNRLVTQYPSHSFVIDRKEAKLLFKQVRQPDSAEAEVATWVRQYGSVWQDSSTPTVLTAIPVLNGEGANNGKSTSAPKNTRNRTSTGHTSSAEGTPSAEPANSPGSNKGDTGSKRNPRKAKQTGKPRGAS